MNEPFRHGSLSKCSEPGLNRNLSATTCARPDGLKKDANDPLISRIQPGSYHAPSARSRPVITARQKASLEETTGYDYHFLRLERENRSGARRLEQAGSKKRSAEAI